jgi:uncharacterized protein YidB (DUF937 family)
MGIFDSIVGMAEQAMAGSGSNEAKVATGLMQALQEHPEGVQGLLNGLQQSGLGAHAEQWANGTTTSATPEQVQAGLGNNGFLESIAEKAGVSPEIAQMALTTVLPMVLAHVAPNGQAAQPGDLSSLAGSLLQRFLQK